MSNNNHSEITELQAIRKILEEHRQLLESMEVAIIGNTKLGIKGIVKRQDQQELDINDIKKWQSGLTGRLILIGAFVGGSLAGSFEGVKHIIELFK